MISEEEFNKLTEAEKLDLINGLDEARKKAEESAAAERKTFLNSLFSNKPAPSPAGGESVEDGEDGEDGEIDLSKCPAYQKLKKGLLRR